MHKLVMLIVTIGVALGLAAATPGFAQPRTPAGDAAARVAQTALLEATRQDMVTLRLDQISGQFDNLVRDLRSNGIDDAHLNDDLNTLAERVRTLRKRWVENVRSNLRAVADGEAASRAEIDAIQDDLSRVVRELAVLLLEAGVRHATEVAATRLDDIIDRQVRLMDSTPEGQQAPQAQRQLAAELEELLGELQTLANPLANPLAAMRLARVRKMIENGQAANAMQAAAASLKADNRETARTRQSEALSTLRAAREKLREKEKGDRRNNLRARRLAAARQLDQIRVHQDRQLDFISRIEGVSPQNKAFDRLLESDRRQLQELRGLASALPTDDKWTPAIRAPIKQAALRIEAALTAFKAGDREQALRESRSVVRSLRVAADRIERKVTVLQNIESHLALGEDMRYVAGFLADAESEQQDLRGAPPDQRQTQKDQRVVAGAVGELRETVDGVSEAASVSAPMKKAHDVMTTLTRRETIEQGNVPDLRQQAEERVGTAKQRAEAVAARAEYVAEWLEYLGRQQADLLSLLARQIDLRERTEREAERLFGDLSGEQDILLGETEAYAENMEFGDQHFAAAAQEMRQAITKLNEVDRDRAVFHQKRAEDALRKAAKALSDLMGRVADLTTLELVRAYEAEVHLLTKVLMLAVEQRHIRFRTRKATVQEMGKFTAREQEHLRRVTLSLTMDERAAELGDLIDGLSEAADVMAEAVDDLNQGNRDPAIKHQLQAEKILRIFIAELSAELLSVMDVVPPEAEGGGGDGWMVNTAMPMESMRVFGESPVAPHQGTTIGPSTWEPLNARERSALSENFARELPLEYRTMLKAYYRSLAD